MLLYPAIEAAHARPRRKPRFSAPISGRRSRRSTGLVDMVAAAVAGAPEALPGTQMSRGVKGRKRIIAYFSDRFPAPRQELQG